MGIEETERGAVGEGLRAGLFKWFNTIKGEI